MNFRTCCLTWLLCLTTFPMYAQRTDSLSILIGTTGTYAGKNHLPLWLAANQFGTITDQQADVSSHIRLTNTHFLSRRVKPDTLRGNRKSNRLYAAYGADLYNNNHFRSFFVQEGYVKLGYKNWQLRGGRYEEIIGEVDQEVSSGSLAVSRNALPIPRVGIAVVDYTRVPFTNGWLQFKGRYSHGWLGAKQHVKNAFLHEKSFYLRAGRGRLYVYGGLNHFAQWGGQHPAGPAPARFEDYLRVVAGAKGNGADPVFQQGPVDIANAVGNHMIIPDFGVTFNAKGATWKLYTQNIFEKGKGRGAYERDRLVGLKIFGRDRLAGLSWENTNGGLVQKLVLEAIYTKHQGGPVIFEGRDNYYNNAVYGSGWQYHGQIIGTPLFINRNRGIHHQVAQTATEGWEIISNRVVGGHVGLKGQFSKKVGYRTLGTYVQHFGNYDNAPDFAPFKGQLQLLQEITCGVSSNLSATAALGYDTGSLSKNLGALLRMEWSLR